jgi:hypothetical protein
MHTASANVPSAFMKLLADGEFLEAVRFIQRLHGSVANVRFEQIALIRDQPAQKPLTD